MQRIAQFFKVSEENFVNAMKEDFPQYTEEDIRDMYESLSLPKRATKGSAGYDFYAPFAFSLPPGATIKIPTGIRAKMDENWVLKLYPRSGLGFKFRLQMNNTVGIIDSDYFNSDNEGHIFLKLTNDSNEGRTVDVNAGTGVVQGIFLEYGITVDDEADGVRNGGFGSTTTSV
ncbi:MAG: deoxyuridine 5'-triphosphate nucleotidohydrolase [Lachnospiraceae bacterium]|nr:deoxyuridine 5'-triphosphate nucleotidohydrolase [Lachnospiraceae bacterium]